MLRYGIIIISIYQLGYAQFDWFRNRGCETIFNRSRNKKADRSCFVSILWIVFEHFAFKVRGFKKRLKMFFVLHLLKHWWIQSNLNYLDLDYLDYSIIWTFLSGPVFSWILTSCYLENLKVQIDRLNPFKILFETVYYLCSKVGREVFEANKYGWTF